MPVFNNVLAGAAGSGGAGDYTIERSLRFNDNDSAKLTKSFSTAGNQSKWTWSGWVKRSSLGTKHHLFAIHASDNNSGYFRFGFNSDNTLFCGIWSKSVLTSTAVFRDLSAWMHIVLVVDLGNSTAADKLILWVNGVRQSVTLNVGSDSSYAINSAGLHNIGSQTNTTQHFDGYMADVHFLDGIAVSDATDFGAFDEDTGVWNPIEYTGDYNAAATPGTQYSTTSTISGASGLFDGDTTNHVSQAMDGNYKTVTTEPITFTLNNGTFTYSTNNCGATGGNNNRYLRLTRQSDGQTIELTENSCNGWLIPNAWTGITISKIEWKRWSSYENISAVYVDSTMLVDSGTPAGVNGFHLDFSSSDLGEDKAGSNDWTANNLFSVTSNYANAVDTATNGEVPNGGTPYIVDVQPISAHLSYGNASGIENVFNGVYNSGYVYWTGDQYTTGTVTRARFDLRNFPNVTSVRWYGGNLAGNYTPYTYKLLDADKNEISGTSGTGSSGNSWNVVTVAGTPRYLEFSCDSGSGRRNKLYAIEVNGTILQNSEAAELDVLLDSPTNYEAGTNIGGNYATLNPLDTVNTPVLSNGNLDQTETASEYGRARSTISFDVEDSNGYYAEATANGSVATSTGFGIIPVNQVLDTGSTNGISGYKGLSGRTTGWWIVDGAVNGTTNTNLSASTGDVLGVAVKAGTATFYINGVSVGTLTGLSGQYAFLASTYGTNNSISVNFGQRPFSISSIPTGHKPLCTQSLDDPLIKDPSTAFDAIVYDGDNTFPRNITDLGFSPDFVWTKVRSQAYRHMLFDTVRGAGKNLTSNQTNAETTNDNYGYISAFDSDGWTIAAGATSGENFNANSQAYVSWVWDGGDLATNSAYNQSQVWSTFGDSNAKTNENWTHVFDGNETAAPHVVANSGSTTVWTPSTPITFTKLEIYANNDGYGDITLNGSISTSGTVPSGGGSNIGWANVTSLISNNTLTSIEVPNSYNSDPTRLGAIKVDDKYLVDPGVIPAGSLNSSIYDQSQRWRNYITSSNGFHVSYPPANAFNGVFDATGGLATAGADGVVTFTPPAMTVTSLEVNVYANSTITLPDGTTRSITGSGTVDNWSTVDIGSGFSFTGSNSITFTPPTGVYTYIERIKINGKELVDDDVTVTNVPSIASTVRASPSSGFSIVSWKGTANASVAHGLGKKPELVITKSRTNAVAWRIWSSQFTNETNRYMGFDNIAESTFSGTYWGTIDSNTLGMPGGTYDNNVGDMIAYCFTSIDSYSVVSKYIGNGSSNGSFVFCNFRPRFVVIKSMSTGHWRTYDSARKTYNEMNNSLHWSTNEDETVYGNDEIDFLSNGFKLRGNGSFFNSSGVEYLYFAIAESPLKYARAR